MSEQATYRFTLCVEKVADPFPDTLEYRAEVKAEHASDAILRYIMTLPEDCASAWTREAAQTDDKELSLKLMGNAAIANGMAERLNT